MTARTPLCDLLGIEHPIVGFTPSEHVAAAVSRRAAWACSAASASTTRPSSMPC